MKDIKKNVGKMVIKILLSAIILFLIFQKVNFSDVFNEIKTISIGDFFILSVLFLILVVIQVVKWKVLIPKVSIGSLLKATFYSKFYSLVLPGQLFGEASKVLVLGKNIENYYEVTISVIVDKIVSLIGLFLMGMIGILFTASEIPYWFSVSFVLCTILMIVMLFLVKLPLINRTIEKVIKFLTEKWPSQKKIAEKISYFISVWCEYLKYKKRLLLCLIGGVVFSLGNVLVYRYVAHIFEVSISIFDWCWISAMLSVILLIPISFGGLGLRDGSFVGMLGFLGVPIGKSMSISIVETVFAILLSLIGGVVVLIDLVKH